MCIFWGVCGPEWAGELGAGRFRWSVEHLCLLEEPEAFFACFSGGGGASNERTGDKFHRVEGKRCYSGTQCWAGWCGRVGLKERS